MSLLAFHSGSPKDFAVNCIYFVNIRQLDIFPAVFGFFFFLVKILVYFTFLVVQFKVLHMR